MAAINLEIQLSNGTGLGKVVYFHGLDHKLVIRPTIHGEPLLTSQAFYYIEQLDSVAAIRFEPISDRISDEDVEYLIDNYLFEYSTIYRDSKLNTKVTDFKYWKYNDSDFYQFYDKANTRALTLDPYNDPTVLRVEPYDDELGAYNDYCLVKDYSDDVINSHISSMMKLTKKKAMVQIMPNDMRDGYIGKLKLLKTDPGLIDYSVAMNLELHINSETLKANDKSVALKSHIDEDFEYLLPVETIHLTKYYNPILLSYYFSGLKESNPLSTFIGYYNVLEYYFEDAPIILDEMVRGEREQLKKVIKLVTDSESLERFISDVGKGYKNIISRDISTSSGPHINGLIFDHNDILEEVGRWLYSIRCAIVHSKRTMRGNDSSFFKPYSSDSDNVKIVIPIIQFLAIECIKKDYEISNEDQLK